ncbi:MAG: DUF4417 domain-containing protein [Bacteroidales bacterium]|nr:DUF4417 domain-containing protein [Bacteroidales bacterium]
MTDRSQMPMIQAYRGAIPEAIVAFHRARRKKLRKTMAVHFYTDDVHFECVWKRPYMYIRMLQNASFVISTDYSLYSNMSLPEVWWNNYRNKLLCAWWQKHSINVIPNVSWWRGCTNEFILEGYPKESVIAINSTGIGQDTYAKRQWLKGYEKVLETLKPIHILRYGAMQDGENTSISTYYKNDNYNAVTYGR